MLSALVLAASLGCGAAAPPPAPVPIAESASAPEPVAPVEASPTDQELVERYLRALVARDPAGVRASAAAPHMVDSVCHHVATVDALVAMITEFNQPGNLRIGEVRPATPEEDALIAERMDRHLRGCDDEQRALALEAQRMEHRWSVVPVASDDRPSDRITIRFSRVDGGWRVTGFRD